MPTAMDHAPTLANDSITMDGLNLEKASGADADEPLTLELGEGELSHRVELMVSK